MIAPGEDFGDGMASDQRKVKCGGMNRIHENSQEKNHRMSAYDRTMRQAAKQSAAGHGIASFFSRTKKPPAASKSTPPPVKPTYSSVVVDDAGREEQAHRQFELLAKDFKG